MKFKPWLLFYLILLVSCSQLETTYSSWEPWSLSDLVMLEKSSGVDASNDLIGAYTRVHGDDFQFRLDFLDLTTDANFDIYLFMDFIPGYNLSLEEIEKNLIDKTLSPGKWDCLLKLPGNGNPEAIDLNTIDQICKFTPRIHRDPLQDTIIISYNNNLLNLPSPWEFQVFITNPGGESLLEKSSILLTDRTVFFQPALLLLEFTDTFGAKTAAQALRYWDGAHAGPLGKRHGLRHLLQQADLYNIPIVLLDIKTPENLSALDFINGMQLIRDLDQQGLALLPDVVDSHQINYSMRLNQKIAKSFGLPGSSFLFSLDPSLDNDYPFQFMSLSNLTQVQRYSDHVYIPLPNFSPQEAITQVNRDGLNLDIRKKLLDVALSDDPSDLVVLGGSLQDSTWADSDSVQAAFSYIANHPWIQPINGERLKGLSTVSIDEIINFIPSTIPAIDLFNSQGQKLKWNSSILKEQIATELQSAPKNTISDSAWNMFNSLTVIDLNTEQLMMKYQYLHQVKVLILASQWADHPFSRYDCNSDIDLDQLPECILTSENYFASLDIESGSLQFLFFRINGEVHQVVGPSSQSAVGLSDQSEWQPGYGQASDPLVINGITIKNPKQSTQFQILNTEPDFLSLIDRSNSMGVYYLFSDLNLSIRINSDQPIAFQIPLMIDPLLRFLPGWSDNYQSSQKLDECIWIVKHDIKIKVESTVSITCVDFNESRSLLSKPEDPNQDFPPGHFLPFPVALVKGMGDHEVIIKINVTE